MSSAILFAAIVVIWIGVLVPRWLRHDHAYDGHLRLRRFSLQRAADQQDGGTNERAGSSQGGRPRYTSFGDHGEPREDQAKAGGAGRDRDASPSEYNNLSRNYDDAYAPVGGSGNIGDMAQRYETDEAPAPVRSYGWSAEEYLRREREHLRHERTSQRAPHDGRPPWDAKSRVAGHAASARSMTSARSTAADATAAGTTTSSGGVTGAGARPRAGRPRTASGRPG